MRDPITWLYEQSEAKWVKPILISLAAFFLLLLILPNEVTERTFAFVRGVSPIFIAAGLLFIFWDQWIKYTRMKFHVETPTVLLEIKLPEEITQSPLAMETVLAAIYQSGVVENAIDAFIKGKTRPWFSLEIATLEGQIHFYIWTRTKYKNYVESQIYAQYPEVEVYEVPDYTALIPFDPTLTHVKCWGIETKLHKPDPYPIKTYVDYGLADEQKEEFKVDPLNALLEFFGTFGKGEYGWVQIGIKAHEPYPNRFYKYPREGLKKHWKEQAKEEVEKILEKLKKSGDAQGITFARIPTKGEADIIASIQKNVNKKPYECIIRTLYMAYAENYNNSRHAGFPSAFRAFETHELNGFKPLFVLTIKYPWYDWRDLRKRYKSKHLYESYINRGFFFYPYAKHHPFVLSVEELATIYHFPGRVNRTPTLERIPSKKAEAPSNIPT